MAPSKKRKRRKDRATNTKHPRNKYSVNPPDFGLLASLYPSFNPFVFYSREGKPRIDWKDYNATRELTRVLLLHDHSIIWWIPDGQLCPTVPNRSNYIHWIEDLLSLDIIPGNRADRDVVRGFDMGTGANCIYPLLGASLLGWRFVGSDVTDVALEWSAKNVSNNPQISELIEIRKVEYDEKVGIEEFHIADVAESETDVSLGNLEVASIGPSVSCPVELHSGAKTSYHGAPILVGVVRDGEKFDFCMCNPPFFETMEEAGLNPKNACGGTSKEMVCSGGEQAFITRIIEDSVKLNRLFRWYTSMVGRKSNLKILISKLRDVGVTIVKTSEFVQGQTCRWGLAWSFLPPSTKSVTSYVSEKKNLSLMLEGLQRQYSAFHVLQSVETFFSSSGASCKLDATCFKIDVITSKDQCEAMLKTEAQSKRGAENFEQESGMSDSSNNFDSPELHLNISVFQQIPGTLLVKGSLQQGESPNSGDLFLVFHHLEEVLRNRFCKVKARRERPNN